MLKLLADGPTLQQLTQRISQESPDGISLRSVSEDLVALQNRGYVFLEEGRWWRTPEGVTRLERLLAEESSRVLQRRESEIQAKVIPQRFRFSEDLRHLLARLQWRTWARPPRIGLAEVVLLVGQIVFVCSSLGAWTAQSEIRTYYLDDAFHMRILSEMHKQPFAYYEIYDRLYRQMYVNVAPAMYRFPLLFYLWLTLADVVGIKWLYFAFAVLGSVASYFTVSILTKSKAFAIFTAVSISYYLRQSIYFMTEYWAITVFLVAMAFFVSNREISATVLLAVATLIKETFAPFMVFAFVYYFLANTKTMLKTQGHTLREIFTSVYYLTAHKRETMVWGVSTVLTGLAYLVHSVLSRSLDKQSVLFFSRFNIGILPDLFQSNFYHDPPLPIIVCIVLALIGMSAVTGDKRIIAYTSFFLMPLLMLTAAPNPPYTYTLEAGPPSRWLPMQITMVNLFWLSGICRIAQVVFGARSRINLRH